MNQRLSPYLIILIAIALAGTLGVGWPVSPVAAQALADRHIVLHELSQIGGPIVSASADGRVVVSVQVGQTIELPGWPG